jgi:fructokinase
MLDVVCFGEILWDVFETSARGRDPLARTFRRELGGAPANVATGLARLGARAAVVGGVGRDRFGEALVRHLARDGVDVRFVVKLPNRTGLTFVVRDARGEPEFVFYRHESADLAIRAEHVTAAMGRAQWVLVGTSTLMTPDLARATERFLDAADAVGARVFVDLNVRAHLWPDRRTMERAIAQLVARAAIVKASEADLAAVTGSAGSPESGPTHRGGSAGSPESGPTHRGGSAGSPESGPTHRRGRTAAMRWLERHAPRASWLVTRGAGRASATGVHGVVERAALPGRCVDATGAGDAFIAGALATLVAAGAVPGSTAWADPRVWQAALRAGHIMGKKAVSRPGAVAGLVRLGRVRAVVESVRRSR